MYIVAANGQSVVFEVAKAERESTALKKDKVALEQKVRMLKEVIQKNRGNFLFCLCYGSLLFGRLGVDVFFCFINGWNREPSEGAAGTQVGISNYSRPC